MTTPAFNRVLLAEDDEIARRMIGHFLTAWGFEVVSAEDGMEAMEILEGDDAPSLAIVDWMMPRMEGIEVCHQVRLLRNRPYTYLILLTAKSDKDAVTAGLEAGADDYVTKPCDFNELRARLRVGQRVVSLERTRERQMVELRDTLEQVRRLKEMLPICAWCKRVRDDADYWQTIEEYLHTHAGTDFTHGICPHCVETVRAGLMQPLER